MKYTDGYKHGWHAMAEQFHFDISQNGVYSHYRFPGTWENGWITEVNPFEDLSVSSAWFTSKQSLEYSMPITEPSLSIFCMDTGNITIKQQGKKTRIVNSFTQLVITNGKPLKILIPANEHICFTNLIITESCINTFLDVNHIDYPIRLMDAKKWHPSNVDTPLAMLIMEQIRWGVRGNRIPPPAYLCKAIELLCLFAHNAQHDKAHHKRRYYVTWENEQKLYRVKTHIDDNPLTPIKIDDLCSLAEMSESKLRITFKSQYHQSLYAYIRESIMKRAMQMLGNDELSIKNIASACGYKNPAKFAAAFKTVYGITPSDFRKGFGL